MEERKILNKEHEAELLKQVEVGKQVERLVALPAWSEILEPAIKSKMEGLTRTLLTTKFENLAEFYAVQQGANALKSLLECVDDFIKAGREAVETLKTNVTIVDSEAKGIYNE